MKEVWTLRLNWLLLVLSSVLVATNISSVTSFHQFVTNPTSDKINTTVSKVCDCVCLCDCVCDCVCGWLCVCDCVWDVCGWLCVHVCVTVCVHVCVTVCVWVTGVCVCTCWGVWVCILAEPSTFTPHPNELLYSWLFSVILTYKLSKFFMYAQIWTNILRLAGLLNRPQVHAVR